MNTPTCRTDPARPHAPFGLRRAARNRSRFAPSRVSNSRYLRSWIDHHAQVYAELLRTIDAAPRPCDA